MANKKQRSAVQRREQTRQQRQQRMNSESAQTRGRSARRQGSRNNSWLFVAGIIVMAVVVIGGFILLKQVQNNQLMSGVVPAEKTIKSVDKSALGTIGPGSAQSKLQAIQDDPLKNPAGSSSKPVFLYVGGEYCPFCAAQRWAVINSLSRFGQFGQLTPIVSSEQSVPTFTFHGITYTSQYIDFVAYEQDGQKQGEVLDTVPKQYTDIMTKYSQQTQNGIPFIDIANQMISAGSYYQPDVLVGHSYQEINDQLKDTNSDIARGVYGSSNILTAAICTALNNKPADVCSDPTIQQIQKTPAKTSLVPGSNGLLASAIMTGDALVPQTRRSS